MLVKPTAEKVADDACWERAMQWTMGDFGYKNCPIFHAKVVGEEGGEVLFSPLRCFTKVGPTILAARKRPCEEASRCFATTGQVIQVRTDQPGKCSKCAPTFLVRTQFFQNNTIENAKKERSLSLEEIQEIVSLRVVENADSTLPKKPKKTGALLRCSLQWSSCKRKWIFFSIDITLVAHPRLPSVKRNWGKQRTCYHAFKDWNALDSDLKNSDTICQFKRNFFFKSISL